MKRKQEDGRWQCSCGIWNHATSAVCIACGTPRGGK